MRELFRAVVGLLAGIACAAWTMGVVAYMLGMR